jgi:short-subunit dehydrogenase involved in D-alanine esterification of teichoic acids
MHAFSMALRVQLGKVGVKVFEIVPPMVDNRPQSGRTRQARQVEGRARP